MNVNIINERGFLSVENEVVEKIDGMGGTNW